MVLSQYTTGKRASEESLTLRDSYCTEEDLRGNTAKLVDQRVRLTRLSAKPFNTLQ